MLIWHFVVLCGSLKEDERSPRTITILQLQPGTSKAQPTIPGVDGIQFILVLMIVMVHRLVMEVD